MELILYSDYFLRVLFYFSRMSEQTVTVADIASFYQIYKNNLVKFVHHLIWLSLIHAIQGKGGEIQ